MNEFNGQSSGTTNDDLENFVLIVGNRSLNDYLVLITNLANAGYEPIFYSTADLSRVMADVVKDSEFIRGIIVDLDAQEKYGHPPSDFVREISAVMADPEIIPSEYVCPVFAIASDQGGFRDAPEADIHRVKNLPNFSLIVSDIINADPNHSPSSDLSGIDNV